MMDLNSQWENYQNFGVFECEEEEEKEENRETPKCSEIYISTKTKIAYLNTPIDLFDIFWKIPVIKYEIPKEGVLKKHLFREGEYVDLVLFSILEEDFRKVK